MVATGDKYCAVRDDAGQWRLVTVDEPHIEMVVSRIDRINDALWVWMREPAPPRRPGATRQWRGGATIAVRAEQLVGHEATRPPAPVVARDEVDVSTLTD